MTDQQEEASESKEETNVVDADGDVDVNSRKRNLRGAGNDEDECVSNPDAKKMKLGDVVT